MGQGQPRGAMLLTALMFLLQPLLPHSPVPQFPHLGQHLPGEQLLGGNVKLMEYE